MSVKITYTPLVGTGTRTVDLGTRPVVDFPFVPSSDRQKSISHGGKSYSVGHDPWFDVTCEMTNIRPASQELLHQQLFAFQSHVQQGGNFAFALDGDRDDATTMSVGEPSGETVVALTSSSGLLANHEVYIEDVDNPFVFERAHVSTNDSGTQITLKNGLVFDYGSGSVVRHSEYLPLCSMQGMIYRERRAGRGAGVWDLRLQFRSVR